jgi:preprotein translocase subunit SecA
LSANDYLAERDAEWMGPLLDAAGASVGCVTSSAPRHERVANYAADVVYVPVSEAGFDVLRDRVRRDGSDAVGLTLDAAILDEADAVLLDEARVPLVLAAESSTAGRTDDELAALVADLIEGVHFEVDADRRALHLTEDGIQAVERHYPGVDLFGADDEVLTKVNVALHAQALLQRDVDYVVTGDRVKLVSATRGRVEELQRWPEGLQEAVESKEGLTATGRAEVLDQLLVRDLVRLYADVVGMSATLVVAASELLELYELRCGPLPPNRPCRRLDEPDRLYETAAERDAAAATFVAERNAEGQPVLVATQSVAASERFAALLVDRGLDPVVLNAKNDAEEAALIAAAGSVGRITVSTQMAGRGTDIRLGEGAAERGGLCVVGLERFPSARLDGQLRGRSGRQGDPGRSVFFASLDDDLVTQNLPDHPLPQRVRADGLVTDRRLSDVTDRAQRVSDGQQEQLRDLARRYGALPARQRDELLDFRAEVLTGERAADELADRLAEDLERVRSGVGDAEFSAAARTAVLGRLDRAWSDHLAYALELREGIHLRALGRLEPLAEYNRLLVASYRSLVDEALDDAARLVAEAPVVDGRIVLDESEVGRPGATWTYMVTDDHFGSEWARLGRAILGRRRGG